MVISSYNGIILSFDYLAYIVHTLEDNAFKCFFVVGSHCHIGLGHYEAVRSVTDVGHSNLTATSAGHSETSKIPSKVGAGGNSDIGTGMRIVVIAFGKHLTAQLNRTAFSRIILGENLVTIDAEVRHDNNISIWHSEGVLAIPIRSQGGSHLSYQVGNSHFTGLIVRVGRDSECHSLSGYCLVISQINQTSPFGNNSSSNIPR